MNRRIIISLILILVVGAIIIYRNQGTNQSLQSEQNQNPASRSNNDTDFSLKLPPDFSVTTFAQDLEAPRVLALDPSGTLLSSIPAQGRIVALPDSDNDFKADQAITVASGLNRPHGLALSCGPSVCQLFVGETDKVVAFDYNWTTHKATNKKKLVDLPGGGRHYTRSIGIGPDGRLYVTIGSSCDVCHEADARRAKIYSLKTDGSDFKEYAAGLRNAPFFAWNPIDGKMWATEMGRDNLGDDLPPDEVNIVEQGKNYGWPICYGQNIHDTEFDNNTRYIQDPCRDKARPHIEIPAHSAPLGLAFIPEEGWPEEYRLDLLVALHGSWNRSSPIGYKVVRYKLDDNGRVLGVEDFLAGFLQNGEVSGRPVDILVQPGGNIYISDDKAGIIYRVSLRQP
jgi:glucose/arabinose dehydrogenase